MAKNVDTSRPLSRADFLYLRDRKRLPSAYALDPRDDSFTDAERRSARRAERLYAEKYYEETSSGDPEDQDSAPPSPQKDDGPGEDPSEDENEEETEGDDEEEIPPYEEWSKKDLRAEIDERGLEVSSKANVKDLVQALEDDDEISEEEDE